MKKLLGILILGLLVCSSNFADAKSYKPDQIFKWKESTHGWGKMQTHDGIPNNDWNVNLDKDIVRDGKYSIKFEMRDGDCLGYDCKREGGGGNTGHDELTFTHWDSNTAKNVRGDWGHLWYAWSLYLPESTEGYEKAWTILGQFKTWTTYAEIKFAEVADDEKCPEIPVVFKLRPQGLVLLKDKLLDKCSVDHSDWKTLIIPRKDLYNKWQDFLMEVIWTEKDTGIINLWVNDKLVYRHKGKTVGAKILRKKDNRIHGITFRFGIYNGKRHKVDYKTQIAYYDSFARSGKCKKAAMWHDCKNLPSKLIQYAYNKKDSTYKGEATYIALIKNKTDDSVLIKVRAASKELAIEEAMKKCTEKHEEGCYVHYSNQVAFGQ